MKKKLLTENTIYLVALVVLAITLLYFDRLAEEQSQEYLGFFEMSKRASAYISNRQYWDAILLLKEMEKKRPDDYRVLWQLGIACYQLNKFTEAEKYFRSALQANPLIVRESVYLLQFARLEISLKRYDIAEAYLEKYLENPANRANAPLWKEAIELQQILQARETSASFQK